MDVDLGGRDSPPARASKIAGIPFGKYTLVCKLATGGMGELFVARKAAAGGFEKLVVIKRLLPHLAEDGHFVAMLLDEARIAARLSHPNVCQVYDLGEVDGHYYITMEHLEGVPASLILRRASRAGERLELGLAAAILRQTAAGLDHAHGLCDHEGNSLDLVHRDVSPSNLFVTGSGVVKVLDFGVAKSTDALARTHTGALKGKYAYMSPEQVLGNHVDRRSDVWSLGIVLFELLTAQRLFWRDSEYKMFQAIVEEPIPSLVDRRPGLSPRVADVANRALSRDPSRRFATAREMGDALEEAMTPSGGIWQPARVAEYLSAHFGQLIQERRQEVQASLVRALRRTSAPPALPEEDSEGGAYADERDGESEGEGNDALDLDLMPFEPTRIAPTTHRRSRRWLAAVALAALAGGGGMLAFRQWAPQSTRPSTPVVVLGGRVEVDGPATGAAPPAPPAPVGGAPAAVAEPTPKSPPARDGVAARKASPSHHDRYSAVMARYQVEFRRCFNQTATGIAGAPAVKVAIDIDRRGIVTEARLVPRELEHTQLGDCVLEISRRAQFGRQTAPVHVTIPLLVRRSK